MATAEQINQASSNSGKWLRDRQAKHVKMVEESIKKLQADILASLDILKKDPNGKIRGLSVNLGNAQKIHAKINKLFQKDYSKEMAKVISDFKNNKALIKSSFKTIGEATKFTDVDETMMKVLRDGNYQQYLALGKTSQDKVTQQVYNSVIAGGTQAELATTIRGALLGSAAKSVVGIPLANYARLYARDMIMNYHNDVILTKGEALGMDHYKYTGTLMASSRDFCKRRVGLTYTKKQIQSWIYKWKGKSGPAWTNRGGYNCRHHWQPIRPEWLSEEEFYGMGKLNTIDKKGEIKTPWQRKKAKPKPKVKPIPPKTIGKGTIPNAPTAKSIEKDLITIRSTPAYLALEKESMGLDKQIKTLEKQRNNWAVETKPKIDKLVEEMIKVKDPQPIHKQIGKLNQQRWDIIDELAGVEKQKILLNRQMIKKENDMVMANIKPPAGGKIQYTTTGLSKAMNNKIARNFEKTEALLHPNVIKNIPEQYVRYESGIRAYYTPGMRRKNVKRQGTLHLGSGSDITQTHEFGHAAEYAIPGLQKKAQDFLKKRAGSDPLTKIYAGTKEMGWSDGFYDHYVGKYYSDGATEIISMGLEQMQRSPLAFFKLDPGHFDFILKIMWGKI